MRIFIVLALLAGLCACGDPEPAKTVDASKELKPHIEKIYAAWGTMDTTKVAPFYSKADGTAYYDIAPLKYSNWVDYAAGFKKMSADWKTAKIDVGSDFQAHSNGAVAWASFTADLAVEKKDGKVELSKARITEILQKEKTGWIVIHEHVSLPVMEPQPPAPVAKTKKAPAKKKGRRR